MRISERPSVMDLDRLVAGLSKHDRDRFHRIYHVSVAEGSLVAPISMHEWVKKQFGSLEAVQNQKVVKVTNVVTFQGALFNELRALRPIEFRDRSGVEAALTELAVGDTFRDSVNGTPEDVFGRVTGKHSVTASNIAKYDGFHGLVIFNEANPLNFTREQVSDYIDVAQQWAEKASAADSSARYYFLMWNCLWRAGASIIHGHMQMTLSRGMHYAAVEYLRRCSRDYHARTNFQYFDDFYLIHESLGCGFQRDGVRVVAPLTPVKEKGVTLIADRFDDALKSAIFDAMVCYRENLGVVSFNLAVHMPPIAAVAEDWSHFPVMIHLVDRGDTKSRMSDIGAMELFAQPVISSDPFVVARALKEAML